MIILVIIILILITILLYNTIILIMIPIIPKTIANMILARFLELFSSLQYIQVPKPAKLNKQAQQTACSVKISLRV